MATGLRLILPLFVVALASGCRGVQLRQLEHRIDQLESRVANLEGRLSAGAESGRK